MIFLNILSILVIITYLIFFDSKILEIFLFLLYGIIIYNIFSFKKVLYSILPIIAFMLISLNISYSILMPKIYNDYCKKIIPTSFCKIYFSKVTEMTSYDQNIIKKGFPNTITIKD